jgi:hypothetical protein
MGSYLPDKKARYVDGRKKKVVSNVLYDACARKGDGVTSHMMDDIVH